MSVNQNANTFSGVPCATTSSSMLTRLWTNINQMIGRKHNVFIMFHNQYAVANVT